MSADCPNCRRNAQLAAQMRGLADAILLPTSMVTGIEPAALSTFVEGTTVGAVKAARAPRGKKISAYTKAYKDAFKRSKPLYITKGGKWKKDGFKRAVRKAHQEARKKVRK